jgi:hypothetical protein
MIKQQGFYKGKYMTLKFITVTMMIMCVSTCLGDALKIQNFDVYKDGMSAKSHNQNNSCDIYKNGKWLFNQESENCIDLTKGKWSVTFDYGTLTGEISCNNMSGLVPEVTNSDDILVLVADTMNSDNTGNNCWCRVIEHTAPDGVSQSLAQSSWVFLYKTSSDSDCVTNCVNSCANDVRNESFIRNAMFNAAML